MASVSLAACIVTAGWAVYGVIRVRPDRNGVQVKLRRVHPLVATAIEAEARQRAPGHTPG